VASAVAGDRLKASARAHRRQLARRLGLKLSELDGLTSEAVAVYARAKAAQALTDPETDPERYWRAANVVGRAWAALERRLREVGLDTAKQPNGAGAVAALANHLRNRDGGAS
jgi:hypothetical protein